MRNLRDELEDGSGEQQRSRSDEDDDDDDEDLPDETDFCSCRLPRFHCCSAQVKAQSSVKLLCLQSSRAHSRRKPVQ